MSVLPQYLSHPHSYAPIAPSSIPLWHTILPSLSLNISLYTLSILCHLPTHLTEWKYHRSTSHVTCMTSYLSYTTSLLWLHWPLPATEGYELCWKPYHSATTLYQFLWDPVWRTHKRFSYLCYISWGFQDRESDREDRATKTHGPEQQRECQYKRSRSKQGSSKSKPEVPHEHRVGCPDTIRYANSTHTILICTCLTLLHNKYSEQWGHLS